MLFLLNTTTSLVVLGGVDERVHGVGEMVGG